MTTTVDWSRWMMLSTEEQQALMERYKRIVRQESEQALQNNYRNMTDAMAKAGRS